MPQSDKEITEKDFETTILTSYDHFGFKPLEASIRAFSLAQSYHKQELEKVFREAEKELLTDEKIEIKSRSYPNPHTFITIATWMRDKASLVIMGLKQQSQNVTDIAVKLSDTHLKTIEEQEKVIAERDEKIKELNEEMELRTKKAGDMLYEKDTQLKELREDVILFGMSLIKCAEIADNQVRKRAEHTPESSIREMTEQLYTKYSESKK